MLGEREDKLAGVGVREEKLARVGARSKGGGGGGPTSPAPPPRGERRRCVRMRVGKGRERHRVNNQHISVD